MGHSRPAYSYMRFSSPKQAGGDSIRRQIAATRKFCEEEGLTLDETLRDDAVSAFRGEHRTEGALGAFLRAVESGTVKKGSVLIIESLDRLSREKIRYSQAELLPLINKGIEIVTLIDRQRYSAQSIDNNPGLLFAALAVAMRAHDESATKSDRLAKKWIAKRAAMAEGKQIKQNLPGWLDWTDGKILPIEPRVRILRQIFEMRAKGAGRRKIAAELNHMKIPTWGRGKRKAKGGWQQSYIHKLLHSRAVIGEFQPYKLTSGRNSTRVPQGDPLANYYPAVIPLKLWNAAQAYNGDPRPRKGRPSKGLLSGLIFDPTGAPMHVEGKGEGLSYFTTALAYRRKTRRTFRWRADHLEQSVLICISELLNTRRIFPEESTTPVVEGHQARLAEIQAEETKITTAINRVATILMSDLGDVSEAVQTQAAELTKRRQDLKAERMSLEQAIRDLTSTPQHSKNLRIELNKDQSDPQVRQNIATEIRRLVNKIVVWPEGDIPEIPIPYLKAVREDVATRLTGTRGIKAKENNRTVGGLKFQFRSGKEMLSWVTYRPSARSDTAPVFLTWSNLDMEVFKEELQRLRFEQTGRAVIEKETVKRHRLDSIPPDSPFDSDAS